MTSSVDRVTEEVVSVIEKILGKPRTAFSLSEGLVRELRISSDDISFYFVPELERRLNVKIPVGEWRTVRTGEDACVVLRKYLNKRVDGN